MPDFEEQIEPVITALRTTLEQKGLYLLGAQIASSAAEEDVERAESMVSLMEDGTEFLINASFHVGSVVWTDRILRPEAHEADIAFQVIAPTAEEIEIERIRNSHADLLDMEITDTEEEHDDDDRP